MNASIEIVDFNKIIFFVFAPHSYGNIENFLLSHRWLEWAISGISDNPLVK